MFEIISNWRFFVNIRIRISFRNWGDWVFTTISSSQTSSHVTLVPHDEIGAWKMRANLISWGLVDFVTAFYKGSPKMKFVQMSQIDTNCFISAHQQRTSIPLALVARWLATHFDLLVEGSCHDLSPFTARTIYHRTLPTDPSSRSSTTLLLPDQEVEMDKSSTETMSTGHPRKEWLTVKVHLLQWNRKRTQRYGVTSGKTPLLYLISIWRILYGNLGYYYFG